MSSFNGLAPGEQVMTDAQLEQMIRDEYPNRVPDGEVISDEEFETLLADITPIVNELYADFGMQPPSQPQPPAQTQQDYALPDELLPEMWKHYPEDQITQVPTTASSPNDTIMDDDDPESPMPKVQRQLSYDASSLPAGQTFGQYGETPWYEPVRQPVCQDDGGVACLGGTSQQFVDTARDRLHQTLNPSPQEFQKFAWGSWSALEADTLPCVNIAAPIPLIDIGPPLIDKKEPVASHFKFGDMLLPQQRKAPKLPKARFPPLKPWVAPGKPAPFE